jgi:5-methylcytosine-specific restriction endonuclease McrA
MEFKDLDLLQVGHSIQLTGAIYASGTKALLCYLPGEDIDLPTDVLVMSLEEWKKFVRQTDLLETEILEHGQDRKLTKALVRKSTRQIEQGVSWNVFRRDGYACRYCGRDTVPLTVDHLVLWEEGGPSIEENLVSSCRKCNKVRGNTQYADWLNHRYYRDKSAGLSEAVKEANVVLLTKLADIPLRVHTRSR